MSAAGGRGVALSAPARAAWIPARPAPVGRALLAAPALLLLFGPGCLGTGLTPDPDKDAPGDRADTADTAPDSGHSGGTGDSGETALFDLDTLLDALREDPDAALLATSRASGWPAPVEGGWLFVTTRRGSWSLAGEHSGWEPEAMTADEGFSWLVREAAPGGGYKFNAGSDWVADPWSRALTYDEYGELSLVLPTSGAHLERQFQVEGQGLDPRDLHLWVPEEWSRTLYVHDGQNLFDPEAMQGGWHLQDSVPDGMLVVGIDNSPARMDEYTHVPDFVKGRWYGGDADTYADFVMEDVRPLIRDIYGDEGLVGTMGSSLGGLVSFHLADRHPGELRFAASLSGTMGWGSIGADNETMIERYEGAGHRATALYLDSGGGGTCGDRDGDGIDDDAPDGEDNYCENLQLRDVLEAEGYVFGEDLWHWWEPGASHDEVSWSERVWRPLEIFASLR